MLIKKKQFNLFFYYLFFVIAFIYVSKPSYGFIPNIYEPNIKELKLKSISLAKTAEQLLYFGQTKKANQLAELATKLNPENDRLWGLLAETQIRIDNPKLARKSLKRAQLINPNEANYWFKEATLDFNINEINNSIILINKGLSIDPKNYSGYFLLGNSRMLKKEYPKALKAYKEANKIKTNFWQSLNNQGLVLYELNEKEKAILIWEKVLTIKDDAEPMLALATAKYKENEENKISITLAKKALLQNPNYVYSTHQKEQLWGKLLREATKRLLNDPQLKDTVAKAIANSTIKNGL